jgi:hypothetical protein
MILATLLGALGLAMVRKRPKLLRQALRTLIIGFAISIALVTLLGLGYVSWNQVLGSSI